MTAATFVIVDEASRDRLVDALQRMTIDPLRPVVIRLVPWDRHVRLRLEGYYRGVVLRALCDLTGYEEDEMHDVLVFAHGKTAQYWSGGDWMAIEDWDFRAQRVWVTFLDLVIRWAAVWLECYIPSPRKVGAA